MESFEKRIPYDQYVRQMPEVKEYLSDAEIDEVLNPANYLGLTQLAIDKVIQG